MGGATSSKVAVLANQDATTGRGLKSILTAELDGFLVPDFFWASYDKQMRGGHSYTRLARLTGARVVTRAITDHPEGFVVHEHRNLGALAYFAHEESHTKHSRDNDTWKSYKYDGPSLTDDVLDHVTVVQVHRSPFRVEAYVEQSGRRLAGELIQHNMQKLLANICDMNQKSPESLQCRPHAKSPSGSGKESVVSEPLDAYFTAQELWKGLVKSLRDGQKVPMEASRRVYKNWFDDGFTEEIFTTEESTIYKKAVAYADERRLVLIDYGLQREMEIPVIKTTWRVFDNPVVLEGWCSPQTVRHSDDDVRDAVQRAVDTAIAEYESVTSGN